MELRRQEERDAGKTEVEKAHERVRVERAKVSHVTHTDMNLRVFFWEDMTHSYVTWLIHSRHASHHTR